MVIRGVQFFPAKKIAGPKLAGWLAFNPKDSFMQLAPGDGETRKGIAARPKTETANDITVGRYFTVNKARGK
jgi:hypothetical protein